jgi:NAD(P)-dependent dehydrogenase (short-subunit alcohol dehydrogenase family)
MDLQLQGKSALVSGSTAGIGRAIAERLAREGARVVVNGRSQERVSAAVRAIEKAVPLDHGVVEPLPARGGSEAEVVRDRARKEPGRLEDEADAPPQLAGGQAAVVDAAKVDGAGGGLVEAVQQTQERGFAGAARSQHRHHLTCP